MWQWGDDSLCGVWIRLAHGVFDVEVTWGRLHGGTWIVCIRWLDCVECWTGGCLIRCSVAVGFALSEFCAPLFLLGEGSPFWKLVATLDLGEFSCVLGVDYHLCWRALCTFIFTEVSVFQLNFRLISTALIA